MLWFIYCTYLDYQSAVEVYIIVCQVLGNKFCRIRQVVHHLTQHTNGEYNWCIYRSSGEVGHKMEEYFLVKPLLDMVMCSGPIWSNWTLNLGWIFSLPKIQDNLLSLHHINLVQKNNFYRWFHMFHIFCSGLIGWTGFYSRSFFLIKFRSRCILPLLGELQNFWHMYKS